MSRDKETGDTNYLMNHRDGDTKPFSYKNAALSGKSIKMEYESERAHVQNGKRNDVLVNVV